MKKSQRSVLLISNDPPHCSTHMLLREQFKDQLAFDRLDKLASAVEKLLALPFDVVLLDVEASGAAPVDAINSIREAAPRAPIVVLSRGEEQQLALDAVRAGAHDFVVKERLTAQALGRIIYFAVERQKLLDQLRLSRQRLELALHATKMMLWDWNLATDHTNFGEGTNELLGYALGDQPGHRDRWQDLIHPDDRAAALATVREFLEHPDGDYEDSFRILTSSGPRSVIARGRIDELTPEDSSARMVGTFLDITERVEMERRAGLSQKLEAIGQLAAGIAHEINTPMQYIGDNIAFLRNNLSQLTPWLESILERSVDPPADSTEYDGFCLDQLEQYRRSLQLFLAEGPSALDDCTAGVGSVARIVRAMKEFAHPGNDEKTPVNVNSVVESMVTISRNEWKYVAEVELALDPSLGSVEAIAGELGQVILNMIVNAAHAIGSRFAGGTRQGLIKISTHGFEDWVEIRITDNGPGIPAAIRHRIFEPFFTTKEVGKGTGQGLAIAHTVIVQKHKGTIDIATEVEVGTSFVICLPRTEDRAESRRDDKRQLSQSILTRAPTPECVSSC